MRLISRARQQLMVSEQVSVDCHLCCLDIDLLACHSSHETDIQENCLQTESTELLQDSHGGILGGYELQEHLIVLLTELN